jgi:hypothetical protein
MSRKQLKTHVIRRFSKYPVGGLVLDLREDVGMNGAVALRSTSW